MSLSVILLILLHQHNQKLIKIQPLEFVFQFKLFFICLLSKLEKEKWMSSKKCIQGQLRFLSFSQLLYTEYLMDLLFKL